MNIHGPTKDAVYLAAACLMGIGSATAQETNAVGFLDSGGGKVAVGTFTNHGSIGGPFTTNSVAVGTNLSAPGIIQVLFIGGATTDPDINKNGIPDAWEDEHFPGEPFDPDADSDGDGKSNRMEYIAGTHPRDRTSKFQPSGTFSGMIYTMPFQTVTGRSYRVYATRDLANWYIQGTYTGDDTQKVFTFDETSMPPGPLHSTTHPSKFFFRVEVELP